MGVVLTVVHSGRLDPALLEPRLSLDEAHAAHDALLEDDPKLAHRSDNVAGRDGTVDGAFGRAGGDGPAGEGDWRDE